MKLINFSAGPSILPQEVFKKASESVLDYNQSGLSILEISHRSDAFIKIIENAKSLVKELLSLPAGYEVLFLQGGASLQFLMTAQNLLSKDGNAGYIDTGAWSQKAIKEARSIGTIDVIASSKDKNYNYLPKNFSIPEGLDYLHLTSNNTIFGTQFKTFPKTDAPIVCDMSSDIFSRTLDFNKFSLVYAGAQKNLGPAGTTLVIVKRDLLEKVSNKIPSMLDYQQHLDKESLYNTPPVFAIYVSMLTLEWLKDLGGLNAVEKINNQKSAILYAEIDRNPLFKGFAAKEDRSTMNVTFNLVDENHKEIFDNLWKESGISGLNGHRSVGGYRASIYNAMPIEGIQTLIDCMQQLEKKI